MSIKTVLTIFFRKSLRYLEVRYKFSMFAILALERISSFFFIVITYTFLMSYFGYWLIDRMIPMRVSEASERVGLDFSQHDEHYGLAHIAEREIAEYEEHIRNKAKN